MTQHVNYASGTMPTKATTNKNNIVSSTPTTLFPLLVKQAKTISGHLSRTNFHAKNNLSTMTTENSDGTHHSTKHKSTHGDDELFSTSLYPANGNDQKSCGNEPTKPFFQITNDSSLSSTTMTTIAWNVSDCESASASEYTSDSDDDDSWIQQYLFIVAAKKLPSGQQCHDLLLKLNPDYKPGMLRAYCSRKNQRKYTYCSKKNGKKYSNGPDHGNPAHGNDKQSYGTETAKPFSQPRKDLILSYTTIAMLELNTSDSNSNASSDSVYTYDSHDGDSDSNDGNWEAKT